MLKGINVTWKPKLKKVVMFKKVGNITKSEIDEGTKITTIQDSMVSGDLTIGLMFIFIVISSGQIGHGTILGMDGVIHGG